MISYLLSTITASLIVMVLYGYIRAQVSYLLGDKSSEVTSRLNLNPKSHLDPIGSILMVFFGVGFLKPMRNNHMSFKRRNKDLTLVVILPGLILILISVVSVYTFGAIFESDKIDMFLYIFSTKSILFYIYNLIPIYPLEGEKLITSLGTPNLKMKFTQYSDILKIALLVLTFMGIINIPINFIATIILRILY